MITAGTYCKLHHFRNHECLTLLQDLLLGGFSEHGWKVQAWAVFSNHYHVVAVSSAVSASLKEVIQALHSKTAIAINQLDKTPGRRVWFQYWDTHLTFEKTYLVRLNYVLQNPVRHGLVHRATNYPWCSATWFQENSSRAFLKTVTSFKLDKVNVRDDIDVIWKRPDATDVQFGTSIDSSE
jgi:putative transposase